MLEGALGGPALFEAPRIPPDLTSAQRALIGRIGLSLVDDLATAIRQETGVGMVSGDPKNSGEAREAGDGLYIVCEIQGLSAPTAIILAVSSEVLASSPSSLNKRNSPSHDPRMARAVRQIPVEGVVELGRVSMSMRRVLTLAVGDIIRLPTAPEDSLAIRINGMLKLHGTPLTSKGQLAVEVRGRHSA